jgi:NAD(P)-dependent dehydrogenase (short-subunit alcohol dehydrogenase family)
MTWSTTDIAPLAGRSAVVTGANSGLGLIVARELAVHGADVLLACRDEARAQAALDKVRAAAPDAVVHIARLDLADLASIERFAAELAAGRDRLDLLVNNAGVMATPRRETADGFELQLGTNHLGHFALTGRLLPLLHAAPAPRVVTVSSTAHKMGRMRFDDLMGDRRYRRWEAYGQSKLANLLFAFELQRRAQAAGSPLLSVAAHPGYAATNLQFVGAQMRGNGLEERLNGLANRVLAQSDEQGALPLLYAATMDVPPGAYVGPDGFQEMRGGPALVQARPAAHDEVAAARLWDASEQLTSVRYAFAASAVA